MIEKEEIHAAEILTEQFIHDHVFLYVSRGAIQCYDGNKNCTFKAGEYCIARKNRLARYKIESGKDEFEPVIFCFDEAFLKTRWEKNKKTTIKFRSPDTFVKIKPNKLISDFIFCLNPYSDSSGKNEITFENGKYEELLIILLKNQPELAGILFDFGVPEKINLEEFMNRNFYFNVSIGRFAFLTGRSLSTFKRDFKTLFNDTPNHWLVQKRLQEAYFLIDKKKKKPSEIYLDLGFEALSHFSYAFKKQFKLTPTGLAGLKKTTTVKRGTKKTN
ncbi:helix-turn-helix domain-containing protein [Pedobacter fastidiosus]|uniref:Helix-turn-helix transcriptional regulator n=1 Tax=Pedobacter fastidiosus TaxID=2765361 RepID=A0ABR7KY01_9SPHI|nr:AraC family transcriptional regulator [Pedobacter fastidiosus]MBC6112999.1 helix-turn-helix transcriptional regulator [Pedobacter fastidiosus]